MDFVWWDCGSLYLAKDRVTSGGVLNGRQYLVLQLIGDRNQMRPFPGVEDPFHPLEDPIREKSPPDPPWLSKQWRLPSGRNWSDVEAP